MKDPISASERALAALISGKSLTPSARRTLVERIQDYLNESGHGVTAQYDRLAAHVIKWMALPHKRSNSWRISVDDARGLLHSWERRGGKLAKYIRGEQTMQGHRVTPEDVYEAGMRQAIREYVSANGPKSERQAELIFKLALPSAPPLSFWFERPLLDSELPAYETPSRKRGK